MCKLQNCYRIGLLIVLLGGCFGTQNLALAADPPLSAAKIDELLTKLQTGNSKVKHFAGKELREAGPRAEAALPALIRRLNPDDRQAAQITGIVAAIGVNQPETVLPAILDLIDKLPPTTPVIYRCVESIGNLGAVKPEAVRPALERLLSDDHPKIRSGACGGLVRLGAGAVKSLPALENRVQNDSDGGVRKRAARAIRTIREKAGWAAVPDLLPGEGGHHDGFEKGITNYWRVEFAHPEQAHGQVKLTETEGRSGSKAVAIEQDPGQHATKLVHEFPDGFQGTVSIWVRDIERPRPKGARLNGREGAYYMFSAKDDNREMSIELSQGHRGLRLASRATGGDQPAGSYPDQILARGWHRLDIHIDDKGARGAYDGVPVIAKHPGLTACRRVELTLGRSHGGLIVADDFVAAPFGAKPAPTPAQPEPVPETTVEPAPVEPAPVKPEEPAVVDDKPGQEHKPAWTMYSVGNCSNVAYDAKRGCVWFWCGKLARFDLETEEITYVEQKVGGGQSLAVEGDHVWIGGHHTNQGGGLHMYDIPSKMLMSYTTGNTAEGQRPGMIKNWVRHILAEPGRLWLYNENNLIRPGLTRFQYLETDHEKRWKTLTVKNTESKPGAHDGLISDALEAVFRMDGMRLAINKNVLIQRIGDEGQCGPGVRILPPKGEPFTVKNPRGQTATYSLRRDYPKIGFRYSNDTTIWFNAAVDGKPWKTIPTPLICWEPGKNSFTYFSSDSTESQPGAWDGFLGLIGPMLIDEGEIWFTRSSNVMTGKAAISRYRMADGEFTQYTGETDSGFHPTTGFADMTATPHALFFATSHGLLRYTKVPRFPKITATYPADNTNGAVASPFWLQFDTDMNPKTITGRSIQLLVNGAQAKVTVNYDAEQRRAALTLTGGLPAGMPCELIAKSLAQDIHGNPIPWTRVSFRPQ